jgi:hypothetical protein
MPVRGGLLFLFLGACGGAKTGAASATLANGHCATNAYKVNGVCTCMVGLPTVCGASCVDVASDDSNCGACGHTCEAHATCRVGVCGPPPTTIVAAPATCGGLQLVAKGDTLYWTDKANGKVMSMPASGGSPVAISGAETTAPTLLFVNGDGNGSTVFWLDGKTIRKSAGGAISDVYTHTDGINGLTTSDDGATVYFSSGAKIQSVPTAGATMPVDVEVHNSGQPTALAIEGGFLASTVNYVGGVNVIGLAGPLALCWTNDPQGGTSLDVNCNRVARDQAGIVVDVVVAASSKVLWIDDTIVKMGVLAVDGMERSWDVVQQASGPIKSMTVADGWVYFDSSSTVGTSSTVEKVAMMRDAPSPVALARDVGNPRSIAVSGNSVFWSNDACEIQSVPTGQP